MQDKNKKGKEVAQVDASRPPEGWEESAWREFLTGLAPLLANESDAKWAVGDYLVSRIGSAARAADYHNGRDAVLRETARVFMLSASTLRDRYNTSSKFAPEDRVFDVAWTVYRQFADRDNSVLALREFVEQGGPTSTRSAAKHLGTNEGNVGAPLIVRSLTDSPDKVADVVASLPQATRDELVKQAAKQDYLATARAVNESEPAKKLSKEQATKAKAVAASKADEKPGPVDMMGMFQLVMSWMPDFEKFVNSVQERGITDEAAKFTLSFLAEWRGLADVLEASIKGDLKPLEQEEFDRMVAAIIEQGGAA